MKQKQSGYGIVEVLLAVAVVTALIGAAFIGYKKLNTDVKNNTTITGAVELLSGIRSKWQGFGSYQGIGAASVAKAGLVIKPFTYDSTGPSILMPNGTDTLVIASASPYNAFTATFNMPDGGICTDLMSSSVSLLSGATLGGTDVFTAGALDPAKVGANCADGVAAVLTIR